MLFRSLEFKAVGIVGCDLDLLPLRTVLESFTDAVDRGLFVEQERNLLYVALTRAREQLFLSHAGRPSDFLKGLGSAASAEKIVVPCPGDCCDILHKYPIAGTHGPAREGSSSQAH